MGKYRFFSIPSILNKKVERKEGRETFVERCPIVFNYSPKASDFRLRLSLLPFK
jgi:hypothetical protein